MKIPAEFQKYLLINEKNVVFLSLGHANGPMSIALGILFILAKWSGASQRAFRALNKALASVPGADRLPVYVADTDEDGTERFLFGSGDVPSGTGETYWIRNGVILNRLLRYGEGELPTLRRYTEELLAGDRAGPEDRGG